jgi:hypothetical protein
MMLKIISSIKVSFILFTSLFCYLQILIIGFNLDLFIFLFFFVSFFVEIILKNINILLEED